MERILAKKNKRELYKLQNSKKKDQRRGDEFKKQSWEEFGEKMKRIVKEIRNCSS